LTGTNISNLFNVSIRCLWCSICWLDVLWCFFCN